MNMPINWLVENFTDDSALDSLKEAIKAQGHHLQECTYVPFGGGTYDYFTNDDCVLVMGSLNLCKKLREVKLWRPGVWLDLESDRCLNYYPIFGKHLFNADYAMVPLAELQRNMDFYWEIFSIDDCMFIRPDCGDKTFTGKMWTSAKIKNGNFDRVVHQSRPEELVIVAYPQTLLNEWRFVIADGKVITGSLYKTEGLNRKELCELDTPQAQFAQEMANLHYDITPMYIIDVAENVKHEMRVLEVGSFCCCGLYECDKDIIVKHASELAWDEWKGGS